MAIEQDIQIIAQTLQTAQVRLGDSQAIAEAWARIVEACQRVADRAAAAKLARETPVEE